MNKQNIERAIGQGKQFLTITEIAGIMNIDRGTVRAILKGVPYQPIGRRKLYAVSDVAEVLYRRQV